MSSFSKVKKEADQEEGEIMDIEAQKDGATKTEPSIPGLDLLNMEVDKPTVDDGM